MASDDQRTATWQALGRLLRMQSAARDSERETDAAPAEEKPQPTESFVPQAVEHELGSGDGDEDTRAYATWVRNARRLAAVRAPDSTTALEREPDTTSNTFRDRRAALEAELREDAAVTVQATWRARRGRHPTRNALDGETDAPGRSHVAKDTVQPEHEELEAGLDEDTTSTVRVRARPAPAATAWRRSPEHRKQPAFAIDAGGGAAQEEGGGSASGSSEPKVSKPEIDVAVLVALIGEEAVDGLDEQQMAEMMEYAQQLAREHEIEIEEMLLPPNEPQLELEPEPEPEPRPADAVVATSAAQDAVLTDATEKEAKEKLEEQSRRRRLQSQRATGAAELRRERFLRKPGHAHPTVLSHEAQRAKQKQHASLLARPKARPATASHDGASSITDTAAPSDRFGSVFSGGGVRHQWSIWDDVVESRQLRKRLHVKPSVLSGGLPAPPRNVGWQPDPWPQWPPPLPGLAVRDETETARNNGVSTEWRSADHDDPSRVGHCDHPTTVMPPAKERTKLSPKMQWVATVYSSHTHRRSRSVDRQLQTPRPPSAKPKYRPDAQAAADIAEHTHKEDSGASRGNGSGRLRMRQRNVTSGTATERNAAEDITGNSPGNANRQRFIDSQGALFAEPIQTCHKQQHRRGSDGPRSPNGINMVVRQQVYGAEWPLWKQPQLEHRHNEKLREPWPPASLCGAVLNAGSPSLLLSLSARTIARLSKLHAAGGDVLVDALLAQAQTPAQASTTTTHHSEQTRRSSRKPAADSAHRPGSARLLKTSLDTREVNRL